MGRTGEALPPWNRWSFLTTNSLFHDGNVTHPNTNPKMVTKLPFFGAVAASNKSPRANESIAGDENGIPPTAQPSGGTAEAPAQDQNNTTGVKRPGCETSHGGGAGEAETTTEKVAAGTGTPPAAGTTLDTTANMRGDGGTDKDTSIGAAAAALFNVSAEKMGEMLRNLSPGRKQRLVTALGANETPNQHLPRPMGHTGGPPAMVLPTPHANLFPRADGGAPSYATAAAGAGAEKQVASDSESDEGDLAMLLPPPKVGLSGWQTASRELFAARDKA